MMNRINNLFLQKKYTRNWYLQKWILVLSFVALLGFNLNWLAKNSSPSNLTSSAIANKPVLKPEKKLLTPLGNNDNKPELITPTRIMATEICDNGIDDDGDGLIDCYDPDCTSSSNCDGFFYGNPIPSCNFTANPGDFNLVEIWNTRSANGGVDGDNNQPGTAPFDQRATVMVGDMDGDGVPEVVAKQDNPGKLYMFNGVTGQVEVNISISDNDVFTSVAIGDVDRDGLGEVFFFNATGNLERYDYANGTLTKTFESATAENRLYTPNLADFNHDGVVEVYVGNKIYSAVNGTRLVDGSGSSGAHSGENEPFSVAVDVLADGACANCSGLELVAGNTVYSVNVATGTLNAEVTAAGGLGDGVTSIADVDNDGDLDGIVVSSGKVYVWDLQTSAQLYSTYTLTSTTKGGRANVANFDADDELEIGVAGKDLYIVLDPTGTPGTGTLTSKWEKTGLDDGSERTSSTVFDFDGDGVSEVVYSEEENLVVYNGQTGALKTTIISRSGTRYDNPVVVDVNGDGQTEIILTAQDANGPIDTEQAYVRCLKSTNRVWRPSRAVWNQHNYFITNVNDNLTIPRVQQNYVNVTGFDGKPYKKILNTFLNQASLYDVAGDHIFPAPDMTAELNGGATNICQNGGVINYSFIVKNEGSATLPAGVKIAVFDQDPYNNTPNLVQELTTSEAVPINGSILVSGSSTSGVLTNLHILLNHNHSAATYTLAANTTTTGTAECSYANNYLTIPVIQAAPPNAGLTVGAAGNIVCPNGATDITVATSEVGVTYQLRKGTTNVGATQAGNGGTLNFNTGALTADETFSVLATNAGGCSVVLNTTQTVTVIKQDLIVGALSSTICSGTAGTITLLKSQTGVTYQLRNDAGDSNVGATVPGNGGTITFGTGNLAANTTFNILATGGACVAGAELTGKQTISVVSTPAVGLTVTPDKTTICSGETVSFTITGSTNGVTYQLFSGSANTGNPITSTGGDITLTTGALSANVTISVKASIGSCESTLTSTHAITTINLPNTGLTIGASSTAICSGTGVNVTVASSETGISYQLRNNADNSNVGTPVTGTGGTINLPTGNLSATTTFNVLATKTGCSSVVQASTVTITVSDFASSIENGASVLFCGTSGTLTATAVTGATYQWKKDGVNIGTNSNQLTVSAAGSYVVEVTANGCTRPSSASTVTFNPITTATATITSDATNNTICAGQNITFTATATNGGTNPTYQWRVNGNDVAGATQATFTSNSLNNSDVVTVVMTSSLPCTPAVTSNEISVTVNAIPSVTFTGVEANVEGNNQVTINEGNSVTINLTGAVSYTWTPATGINSQSTDGAQAVLAPTSTTTYTVTATNAAGCQSNGSDTLQVIVTPNTDIFIPSLFSPNGDGQNDRFIVRGNGIQTLRFRVFDRSGHLMYETRSVDEAMTTGWDGTRGGVNQPIGMYTWSIIGTFVDGREISFKGAKAGKINLLR
ncbi:FG-GAP-like repeat-containing protein [Microscilla marina]|uniref:FG-GAP repeat domain protein n=1 Tax=Microscilla marina ATCC 23134 TaxID=313606 RepID=A1ZSR6_MICM2|nr:FG-GAP-like repeat-containing protein [Microscilla marina]EAY26646.1 FG-GAP repeat domain protein [Microscilla marina ATCC 23134]